MKNQQQEIALAILKQKAFTVARGIMLRKEIS